MTDVNLSQFPTEELVAIFSRVAGESKGDISTIFGQLNIPDDLQSTESDKLKEQLKLIKSGNNQDIQNFVNELETASETTKAEILRAAKKGGVTKFVVHWWGPQLFISHSVLAGASDIGSLVAAISAICGPEAAIFAAALGIGIAVLKVIDRGNGITLTKAGWIGPIVPTPQ